MKDVHKKIIAIIIILTVIFGVLGFSILVYDWPDEVSLYVHGRGHNNDITIIGNTWCAKEIYVYYNRIDGSPDCKFIFYTTSSPQFAISLNNKQLYNVIDGGTYHETESIRLTSQYSLRKPILVVSPLGEKDCFFENDVFTLKWRCVERDYFAQEDFLIKYYNVDKVLSLNWTIPEGFNLSIDESWIASNFPEATTSYNDWYMLKGFLLNYDEPWRDVDVDLWYKPDTFETHIEMRT